MNKPLPAKKPQAKTPPAKKQIPVKKQAPDRIDQLVKKHLGNIADAQSAFKCASALLDKHKTNYPELEQYVEHVSRPSSQSSSWRMLKTPGELTIYLKSNLLAWRRHIRSHIREKRNIPTWTGLPGFPHLKRLWQKLSFKSSFHARPGRLLKRQAPKKNRITEPAIMGFRYRGEWREDKAHLG